MFNCQKRAYSIKQKKEIHSVQAPDKEKSSMIRQIIKNVFLSSEVRMFALELLGMYIHTG